MSKNPWLKRHAAKQVHRKWVVQFDSTFTTPMSARQIEVLNEKDLAPGITFGSVNLNFIDGLINANDHELVTMVIDARNSMRNWTCYLKNYESWDISESYDLSGLTFTTSGLGKRKSDLSFEFKYTYCRHCRYN